MALAALVFASVAALAAAQVAQQAQSSAVPAPALPASARPVPPSPAPSTALGYRARGEERRFAGDWYGAIDDFQAALRLNPSYGDALGGLAECYYQLGEYDQALQYVLKAEVFRKGDNALVDLEGFIRLALSDVAGARKRFEAVLLPAPNDLDARFGLALIDLAEGRRTEAKARFEDSLRVNPMNSRAILCLALIALDAGREPDAAVLVDRALEAHADDARVQAVAARVARQRGDRAAALFHARNAIALEPAHGEYRSLLGSLLFESGDYSGSADVMREAIARNRRDNAAWFSLGLAQIALGKPEDAAFSLQTASDLQGDDEIARLAVENLTIETTSLESPRRQPLSDWHVSRGIELEGRSYFDQALVEYRRALRIWPYSVVGRTRLAELEKKRGFPARQLSELRFLESIGKADRSTLDTIEIFASLLQGSVSQAWKTDQYALSKRPYRVALFFQPDQGETIHPEAASIVTRYLTDILASNSRLKILPLAPKVAGPAEAFRLARENDADYYLLLSVDETAREIQAGGEFRVGRTGSLAATLRSYRTGNDRVKSTTVRLSESIVAALQPTGSLLERRQDEALVDLGLSDGLKVGDVLEVVKKGAIDVRNEGLGMTWPKSSVLGTLTIKAIDEELSSGQLKSAGFFDIINIGDEVIAAPPPPDPAAPKKPAAPKPVEPVQFPGLFMAVRQLR